MSRKRSFATVAAFGLAALAATAGAWFGAGYIERTSQAAVTRTLADASLGWAEVETDGLQLILSGTAPDEPARFRAITRAGGVVDPNRIIDRMDVAASRPVSAPRFSLEMLRNEAGVSVIGLMPADVGPDLLDTLLSRADGGDLTVTNMVETSDHPVPDTWEETLRFAISALSDLPRSKISVEAGRITVTAVADSDEQKHDLERTLHRAKPDAVAMTLDIAAPRPVITPFTLRFVIPVEGNHRFEACAVDTERARARVLEAAAEAGFSGRANCVIGLGVPSASWAEASAQGIAALSRLGGGAVTLSDADVSLIARDGTSPELFDTVVAELDASLPDLFVLSAVLPEAAQVDGTGDAETGPPEFVATRAPEGQVQLRGRLFDEAQQAAVVSYGRALFGVSNTYIATREDATLPQGWPTRVLAGLDALSRLESGSVVVQPDLVVLRGRTGNAQAEAQISGLLSSKLGAEADFRVEVTYDEELDPLLNIPTPEECAEELNEILVAQKLSFAPGEPVIDEAGDGPLGRLKEKLDACDRAVFEIGGHTDSQGSEGGNQRLSLARAEAVRSALISRGVSPGQLIAEGYGEAQPIADNETEEGREANRRITFTLLGRRDRDEPVVAPPPAEDAPTETAEPDDDTPSEEATE
ncbi:OmpA family protein [Jannaschia rubra]|uniref:OmpA family protein n=1 Tax=Jannaschia rubra TaxID=282197 RepID=UPI0024935F78|nr:OmpA family protein [Jannaschia rubra]